MLGVFLTLLDKLGHPQPGTCKPSIPSRRPLSVQLLPWFYHGNSYWRDRANRNRPKVQERTLRHRSNELCRVVWRPHWPFMQKHLVRPQFATGFQKAPFGRRTIRLLSDDEDWDSDSRRRSSTQGVAKQPYSHHVHRDPRKSQNSCLRSELSRRCNRTE